MKLQRTLALALGLAALATVPMMAAETYTFDNAHSEVGFNVGYFAMLKVHGAFSKASGSIQYDAKDPAKDSVDMVIDTASIDTRNEMRDKHLRSEAFFDVEKIPTATFKSTKVEAGKDGGLAITGDLSLHGVTKPVVLNAKILGTIEDTMGRQQLMFSASTTINRTDYGIAWNQTNKTGQLRISNDVEIVIQGEAFKGADKPMAKPADKPADKKPAAKY
jgi:polyisoprenoid-binding protein YceI